MRGTHAGKQFTGSRKTNRKVVLIKLDSPPEFGVSSVSCRHAVNAFSEVDGVSSFFSCLRTSPQQLESVAAAVVFFVAAAAAVGAVALHSPLPSGCPPLCTTAAAAGVVMCVSAAVTSHVSGVKACFLSRLLEMASPRGLLSPSPLSTAVSPSDDVSTAARPPHLPPCGPHRHPTSGNLFFFAYATEDEDKQQQQQHFPFPISTSFSLARWNTVFVSVACTVVGCAAAAAAAGLLVAAAWTQQLVAPSEDKEQHVCAAAVEQQQASVFPADVERQEETAAEEDDDSKQEGDAGECCCGEDGVSLR